MSNTIHPFHALSESIDRFNEGRNHMTLEELQDLRETISLNLFYISDDASKAVSNYEAKDYMRKRFFAEREEYYRSTDDEKTGKIHTIADSERLARLDAKQVEEEAVEALRQKERVRIIITATQQVLNALSGRIAQISKVQNG